MRYQVPPDRSVGPVAARPGFELGQYQWGGSRLESYDQAMAKEEEGRAVARDVARELYLVRMEGVLSVSEQCRGELGVMRARVARALETATATAETMRRRDLRIALQLGAAWCCFAGAAAWLLG